MLPSLHLAENEAEWIAPEVNCNATSWRYRLEGGGYATNMTFPNGNGTEVCLGYDLSQFVFSREIAGALSLRERSFSLGEIWGIGACPRQFRFLCVF